MELTSGNTGGNYLDLMTQANLGSENNYNTITARTQQNMIINYDKKTFKVASGNRSKLMEEAKHEELMTNRISNIDEDESQVRFPPIHEV